MSRLRWLPILSVAAVLSITLPARADSSSLTFTDPAGDWQVASQDIVKVTLRSVSAASKHWLEADITLAAPVGAAYTSYVVSFRAGNTCYALATSTVNGAPAQHSAGDASMTPSSLSAASCSDTAAQPTGASATAAVHSSTLQIRAPYALGLRRGLRLQDVGAVVGTQYVEAGISVGANQFSPATGDLASTKQRLSLR